jgi:hypothetical protein
MLEGTITLENARIIFRNFAGEEGKYNRKGDRNFGVLLSPETARELMEDGWNVKFLRAREDGDEEQAWLPVNLSFKNRPAQVVLINHKGRVTLSEGEVDVLDWIDIKTVDMIINPYNWNVNGKTGITAYVKAIFVTIEENELDIKYADLEDLTPRGGQVSE